MTKLDPPPATPSTVDSARNRPRVLLLAEACNPSWSSVPLQAYQRFAELRKVVNVTLVTQIRNREGFESEGVDCTNVVFIDSERVAAPLHKLGKLLTLNHPTALGTRSAVSWLAYLYFERLVWKRYRRELLDGAFDLVHRLTPISPVFPSPMVTKCPVPFIIGPLNGGLRWPKGTAEIQREEGEYINSVRKAYRVLPYVRRTYRKADLVLTATSFVAAGLPYRTRRPCVAFPGNGVDPERFSPQDRVAAGHVDPFTILFVGRLIPLKKPDVLIRGVAAASLPPDRVRIVFVGSGPEEDGLRQVAQESGLEHSTTFVGWIPQSDLANYYRAASLLALPSIHESGGAVLLEAMACGLPPVVIHYGGPAEYVSDAVGVRIPLGAHDELVAGFARVFRELFDNRDRVNALAQSGLAETRDRWSWQAQARRLLDVYESLLTNDVDPAASR